MIWIIVYIVVWVSCMIYITKLLIDDNTSTIAIIVILFLYTVISPVAFAYVLTEIAGYFTDWYNEGPKKPKVLTIKQQRLKKLKRINRFRFLKISI